MSDDDVRTAFLGEGIITIVAVKGQEIVSCIRGVTQTGNIQIVKDVGNVAINFAYTKKACRNTGIASLLVNELCHVIKQQKFKSCTVDFEAQNVEGKYFWLKHFSPICYSMMRKVDDRHGQPVSK